jgi:hypothetical protein
VVVVVPVDLAVAPDEVVQAAGRLLQAAVVQAARVAEVALRPVAPALAAEAVPVGPRPAAVQRFRACRSSMRF